METERHSVVGIGASAGGLESLERFFKNCPNDINASFVIIQHLSTQYKSMMDDLINRYTSMPVHMIEEGAVLRPNEIYLIPAGKLVTLDQDTFNLTDKSDKVLHLPIDVFFKSLAKSFGAQAIAVVLSGTGTDGSRGAVEINAAGGMVIAQDPLDAKFDGMPNSLIATGIVDAVLRVDQIPGRILRHIQHPISLTEQTRVQRATSSVFDLQDDVDAILQSLRNDVGIDFNDYKWATVSRRIERRLQVNQAKSLSHYRSILESSSDEVIALRRELLIPVSSFFRDEEVFELLASKVIPDVVAQANLNEGLRIWVAGNSTGEEAYSLAILFLEVISELGVYVPLKVFATDINPEAIEQASQGCYPESIISEIPDHLLKRYFTFDGERYTVIPELRQCIVFARHNLLTDPPFTKMDFVSCRNTLIYFKNSAQEIALQKLQYALKVSGILLLGKSESLSVNSHKFDPVDSKCKVFRSIEPVFIRDLDSRTLKTKYSMSNKETAPGYRGQSINSSKYVDGALSVLHKKFVPFSMLVNDDLEIIHLFGDPGFFLRFRQGALNNQVSHLVHEKLSPVVTTIFHRVKKVKEDVHSESVTFEIDSNFIKIKVSGYPVYADDEKAQYLIVIECQDDLAIPDSELTLKTISEDVEARIHQLEQELDATRESLQSTIEELETTNEELQATNEELMASNEELQSSNEELQSVNEELNTVNAEYHEKMNILNQINADLDAMGKATSIATIFLNQDLNITRYTPDARHVFKLREQDIGRPLNEVSHVLLYDGLYDDLEDVIATGVTKEREVLSKDGLYFLVRIVFYKLTQHTQGAVISFIDISAAKQSENLQLVIDALPEHIAVLSHSGEILMVNQAWTKFAMANGDASGKLTGVGANYLEACAAEPDNSDAKKAYSGVKAVLEGTLQRSFLEYPCHSPVEERWFAMETIAIEHSLFAAVVSHFNISGWKKKTGQKNE